MTDATITTEQFAAFVRAHRGDYVGEAAQQVRAFVETIEHGRDLLRMILTQQVPAYELVSGRVVPSPDGVRGLPVGVADAHQVVPAQAWCRIGHVMLRSDGWHGCHYRTPYLPVITGAKQINAVVAVFAHHFLTLGGRS